MKRSRIVIHLLMLMLPSWAMVITGCCNAPLATNSTHNPGVVNNMPDLPPACMTLSDHLGAAAAHTALTLPRLVRFRGYNPLQQIRIGRLHGERFTVVTEDGIKLDALYLPPAAEACNNGNETNDGNGELTPRLPIVMVHGYLETKEAHLGRAATFTKAGHGVVLFDLRAHGRSGGTCTTFGVRERHDLASVIDAAQQQGYIGDEVMTLGFSLGGGTVLQHAAIDKRVARVAALAPFGDMAGAVASYRRLYAPWAREAWVTRGFDVATHRTGFAVAQASTLQAVEQIDVPLLLIVGKRDMNLSAAQHTHRLADAKTRGSCRVVEVPMAGHFTLMRLPWKQVALELATFAAAQESRSDEARAEHPDDEL